MARCRTTPNHHPNQCWPIISKAGFILHARVYTRIRAHTPTVAVKVQTCWTFKANADQCKHSNQSRKRSKVTECRRVVLHRDVCGRIPMHTLACLYFYQRRNLRYAVATRRQPQAWTSAPAAGEYARMEYKSVLRSRDIHLRAILQEISLSLIITTVWKITYLRFRLNLPEANMFISCYMTSLRGRCRLKSLASRLFCPPFIQAQLNGYTKAPRHRPLWKEFAGGRWFPLTKVTNAESVSIWWRHHVWWPALWLHSTLPSSASPYLNVTLLPFLCINTTLETPGLTLKITDKVYNVKKIRSETDYTIHVFTIGFIYESFSLLFPSNSTQNRHK